MSTSKPKLIEDELQDALNEMSPEAAAIRDLLERTILEIARLREIVGAVTPGESFDDIAARVGRSPQRED